MLSGRAPFQSYSVENDATAIIERIKGGEFSLQGPEWDFVSDEAKSLIQGTTSFRIVMIVQVVVVSTVVMFGILACGRHLLVKYSIDREHCSHVVVRQRELNVLVSVCLISYIRLRLLSRDSCCGYAGLLTVDAKQRLTIEDLQHNVWIQSQDPDVCSTTPLSSSGLASWKRSDAKVRVSTTMDAFQQAHRDGFRLREVAMAPLAKRRQKKPLPCSDDSSSGDDSASEDSSCSSEESPNKFRDLNSSEISANSIGGQFAFPPSYSTETRTLSASLALVNSGTGTWLEESSESVGLRDSCTSALVPSTTPLFQDLAEFPNIDCAVEEVNSSSPDVGRGLKRRFIVGSSVEECNDDSDDKDDCAVIGGDSDTAQKRRQASTTVL